MEYGNAHADKRRRTETVDEYEPHAVVHHHGYDGQQHQQQQQMQMQQQQQQQMAAEPMAQPAAGIGGAGALQVAQAQGAPPPPPQAEWGGQSVVPLYARAGGLGMGPQDSQVQDMPMPQAGMARMQQQPQQQHQMQQPPPPPKIFDDGPTHVLFPDIYVLYLIGSKGTRIKDLRLRTGVNVEPLNVTEEGAMRKVGNITYRRVIIGEGTDRFKPRQCKPAAFSKAKKELEVILKAGYAEKLEDEARRGGQRLPVRGLPGQQMQQPQQMPMPGSQPRQPPVSVWLPQPQQQPQQPPPQQQPPQQPPQPPPQWVRKVQQQQQNASTEQPHELPSFFAQQPQVPGGDSWLGGGEGGPQGSSSSPWGGGTLMGFTQPVAEVAGVRSLWPAMNDPLAAQKAQQLETDATFAAAFAQQLELEPLGYAGGFAGAGHDQPFDESGLPIPPPPPPEDMDVPPPPPPLSELEALGETAAADETAHTNAFIPEVGSLLNRAGANTCFVNVIIQMLWGIDAFREAFFLHRPGHACAAGNNGCVFCALAQVFQSLNDQSQGQTISTEVLQLAVSVLNSRFAFGEKQDATEVHECILQGLHIALVPEQRSGEQTFVRSIFNVAIEERTLCELCGYHEQLKHYDTWAEYVWARDLINSVPDDGVRILPFEEVLRRTVGQFPGKCQNDKCEKDVTTLKACRVDSLVYSLVIVHESDNVQKKDLQRTLAAVDAEINVSHIYADGLLPRRAVLKHINAFALAHYVAFTWSDMMGAWLLRDDTMCRIVGKTFEDVKAKCVANRYQPGLLFYETVVD